MAAGTSYKNITSYFCDVLHNVMYVVLLWLQFVVSPTEDGTVNDISNSVSCGTLNIPKATMLTKINENGSTV